VLLKQVHEQMFSHDALLKQAQTLKMSQAQSLQRTSCWHVQNLKI
jgi:hypothetical protein